MGLMVLGPQLLGHTMINFVLREFDETTVTVTVMLEPIGIILLALLCRPRTPSPLVIPGGAAILGGVYAAGRSRPAVT